MNEAVQQLLARRPFAVARAAIDVTGVAGIYRGEYIIQPFDSLLASVVPFYLHDRTTQKTVMVESRQRVTTLNQPRAHHHKPGTLILWVGHGPAGGCQNG